MQNIAGSDELKSIGIERFSALNLERVKNFGAILFNIRGVTFT
jgi:hypothetical protein